MHNKQLTWPQRGRLWLRLGLRLILTALAVWTVIRFGRPLLSLFAPFLFALAAAALLNALKALGGIDQDLDLISTQVLEPICRLKTESLGHKNPRLHSDEVLISLCVSALTNPIAALAQRQLPGLKGCGAHFTVVLSDVDEKLYRRLGMHVSYEAKYERQRLYYK